MGGYEESQYAKNIWRVAVNGNGLTGKQRAIDYTMLRSAELTLMNGYRYFVIVEKNADMMHTGNITQGGWSSSSSGTATAVGNRVFGNSSTSGNFSSTTNAIFKPSSDQTIMMFKKKPKKGISYDASLICKSIGGKYGVTCLTNHPGYFSLN